MSDVAGEFGTEILVRWSDCDPAGVVFYPVYFDFFEQAMVAFMEERGLSWGTLLNERGLRFPRVEAHCRYVAPATFGDRLRLRIRVGDRSARSITFAFSVEQARDSTAVADGRVVFVCIRRDLPAGERARAVELPEELLTAFAPLLSPAADPAR